LWTEKSYTDIFEPVGDIWFQLVNG